jgi:hypothetical protein
MPLWGSRDDYANSAIYASQQFNLPVSNTSRVQLYGNTTPNVIVSRSTVGQFAVDVNEQAAAANTGQKGAHAGWNLRTVGQGGRSGRVFYETLVAMGSMAGDGSDDTQLPDIAIQIVTHPQNVSAAANTAISYSVDARALPSGTLTYQWQRGGANIAEAGIYSGVTTPTLAIANNTLLTGNTFGCVIYLTGATTVITANATCTVV